MKLGGELAHGRVEGGLTFSVSSSCTALVKGVGVGRPSRLRARKNRR